MPATASDLAQAFRPVNEWDSKIADKLTEIWVKDSDTWTERKRSEFKALCADARITRATMTPSSHKIHRKIQGRKATPAEHTILSVMFGSRAVHRLSWGADFAKQKSTLPVEAGVVTQDVRRVLRKTWKSRTEATPDEAQKVKQAAKPEEPGPGVETPRGSSQPKATDHDGPELQPPRENVHEARPVFTGESHQRQVDKSTVGDVGEVDGGVESRATAVGGMEARAGFDGGDKVPVRRRTQYDNMRPDTEPAVPNQNEATDQRAQIESGKELPKSRKRKLGLAEGPSAKKHGQKPIQQKDPWEMIQNAKPTEGLKANIKAVEVRCAAREARIAKLEEVVLEMHEELKMLRRQIDSLARYLAGSA
ncbi:hypothetical protein J3459_010904 [Metarhizium acridum]|uniref:uncharacterized protein n=1 Tax=Metarhizium acridum TaxID=92637 RepID=UPI001C6B38F4|nr:hypothetical protein J3458_019618 [Metarhizium acridum]KAG8420620.1 hypothetical protein J3459_010904 [Metarhizium acridum]